MNNIIKMSGGEGIVHRATDSSWIFNNSIIDAAIGIDDNTFTNLYLNNNYIYGTQDFYGIKVGPNSTVINNVVTYTGSGIGKYGSQNPILRYNNS